MGFRRVRSAARRTAWFGSGRDELQRVEGVENTRRQVLEVGAGPLRSLREFNGGLLAMEPGDLIGWAA